MNEGIHLDLDTWIVPGQIRITNLLLSVFPCTLHVWEVNGAGHDQFIGAMTRAGVGLAMTSFGHDQGWSGAGTI